MKYLILLLFASSCTLKTADNTIVEIYSDSPNLNLRLYFQDNIFDKYVEDKSVFSNKNEIQNYYFEVQDQNVIRFRIDFEEFDNPIVNIDKIIITRNNKTNIIEGKELLSFFRFNTAILPTLNNNKLTLELKNKKLDPYFVSKNIQIYL